MLQAYLRSLKKDGEVLRKRKFPVTPDGLTSVLAYLGRDDIYALRDRAGLLMAFFFLLRSSEYCDESRSVEAGMCLRAADVEFYQGDQVVSVTKEWRQQGCSWDSLHITVVDRVVVHIRASKTDPGVGTKRIRHLTHKPLCPVIEMVRYCRAFGYERVHPDTVLFKGLKRSRVSTLCQMSGVATGLDMQRLSSHSLRIGGATALYAAGHAVTTIQREGRWRSEAWRLYIWESFQLLPTLSSDMASSPVGTLAAM